METSVMTRLLRNASRIAALLLLLGTGPLLGSGATVAGDFGVLVMAHGGGPQWNQGVLDAVAPLRDRYPLEVAFGMADACSLQEAVRGLEARGVRRIGVVRLFVSGESWYERTGQIVGLREGAPAAPESGTLPAECTGEHEHAAHRMAFFRLQSRSSFALSREGLLDAPEMGAILAERARGLSREPEKEDVLVLAHGPADDAENERWLAALDARAADVRAALPFHHVAVQTLREDWPEKRQAAEEWVRSFVAGATAAGRRVIVVPYRLFGFGPFAKVLEGQTYAADERGLLPHEKVTGWIARQAEELRAPGEVATAAAPGVAPKQP
jgi:sirohydrochlorin cobaltochelatase